MTSAPRPSRWSHAGAVGTAQLFLAKRKDETAAAVPDELCDEMSLVGPPARIREPYRAWAESWDCTCMPP